MHLVLFELLCSSRLLAALHKPLTSPLPAAPLLLLSISGHRNAAGNADLLLCNSSLLVPPLKWSFSS